MVAIAVFAIYFTLPLIALSAMPVVTLVTTDYQTVLGLPRREREGSGFAERPGARARREPRHRRRRYSRPDKVYLGILAATILFIATNAGVIGASRITYAMAGYRQLPSVFRRMHRKFKTPWIALVVFAGFISILVTPPRQDRLPRERCTRSARCSRSRSRTPR